MSMYIILIYVHVRSILMENRQLLFLLLFVVLPLPTFCPFTCIYLYAIGVKKFVEWFKEYYVEKKYP